MIFAIAPLFLQSLGKPLLTDPDVFGDKVVFCCESDLWLGDLKTNNAVRLTSHVGQESDPRFSPDGSQIAFSAFYDGFQEVYVMPASGGVPRRVTYHSDYAMMLDWAPDGKSILYRARSVPRSFGLYSMPVDGGLPQKLPLEFAAAASYSPDGKSIALTRILRFDEAWFRYQGGQKNEIWIGDLSKKEFRIFYQNRFTSEYPVWAGNEICWLQDVGDGTFQVNSKGLTARNPRVLAGPYPQELRSLQTDGKSLVYERAFTIEYCPLDGSGPRALDFKLVSDAPHTLPYRVAAENYVQDSTIGPTGTRVYVETRGQIVSLPVKEGDARLILAKAGVRYRYPRLSPDAKNLLYFSDETGEQQLYVANADGSEPRQLTRNKKDQLWAAFWSPDSKWIAYWDSQPRLHAVSVDGSKNYDIGWGTSWNWPHISFSPDSKWLSFYELDRINQIGTLFLFDLVKGERVKIGDGMSDDMYPTFSSDGNWIAFVSRRNISMKWDPFLNQQDASPPSRICLLALRSDVKSPFLPTSAEEDPKKEEPKKEDTPQFKLEIDGLYSRLVNLPIRDAAIRDLWFAGDRLLFSNEDSIQYYDLKTKSGGTLVPGQNFEVSHDGKSVLIKSGSDIRVVSSGGENLKLTEGRVGFGRLQLHIDPPKEWHQIYWDAWRLLRDYFYVNNMHGVDWIGIGNKYATYLDRIRSRPELDDLIRWLQSELSTGHMFATTGDTRSKLTASAPAFLGIDAKPDASGFYRIERIYRGDGYHMGEASPFAEVGIGVKEGDYLIEVAGVPARIGSDFMKGLVDRAGQIVQVKVNSRGSAEGARAVYVKPLASERSARMREWVKMNRERVDKLSNGRIAYVYLRSMVATDMADFIQQYFVQRDKEALILDLRFNSGGSISNNIAAVLKQKVVAWFNMRGYPDIWTRQSEYFAGPMCCLMNQFNASNGEEFPHQFRALKLGPLIGKRTWGGEVGSDPGWPLIDGGSISVPAYGAFTMKEGWIIEGVGVSPDIEVDNDPTLFARGEDPQLERAVAEMLEALKKNPVVRPTIPKPPIKLDERSRGG